MHEQCGKETHHLGRLITCLKVNFGLPPLPLGLADRDRLGCWLASLPTDVASTAFIVTSVPNTKEHSEVWFNPARGNQLAVGSSLNGFALWFESQKQLPHLNLGNAQLIRVGGPKNPPWVACSRPMAAVLQHGVALLHSSILVHESRLLCWS